VTLVAFRWGVQNDEGGETYSELRTSTYMYLSKSQDRWARSVELRAADLVGVPQANVEPLQVVSYTAGQLFDTHHDAGTLDGDGSIELVPPVRFATLFLVSSKIIIGCVATAIS
jgi:hypothetical protein